jgi:glycosyltransferase involved in cell wall biosynthesis
VNRDDATKTNHLILLTNHFPYGKAEAFLESEIGFLRRHFASTTILTKNTTDALRQGESEKSVFRISSSGTFNEYLVTMGVLIINTVTVLSLITEEIQSLRKTKRFKPKLVRKFLHDLFKAASRSYYINRIIRNHSRESKITIYSYWLDSSALSAILVSAHGRQVIKVSRAHAGDVYEYRHPDHYISFRSSLIRRLDAIYTISDDARTVLKEYASPSDEHKIIVARLGTKARQKQHTKLTKPFVVVSCSFLLPVKRLHLLIQALPYLSVPVRWIHIGDGPLLNDLEQLATTELADKTNISWQLTGSLTTKQIEDFYDREHVHLFVNCSETEGVPVTIMEAQSYGIPVIAPAVGGIPEIISKENGFLFDKNVTPSDLALLIEKVLTLPATDYQQLRDNSYQNWDSRYNADKNFPTFVRHVLSL